MFALQNTLAYFRLLALIRKTSSLMTFRSDIQHNGSVLLSWVSLTLSVTNNRFMLGVIMSDANMLIVIMLNIMAHIWPKSQFKRKKFSSIKYQCLKPFIESMFIER